MTHTSACAVHNMPHKPNGPCDCGAWAREVADCTINDCYEEDPDGSDGDILARHIAAALIAAERRGHAKGMREAAEIADKLGGEFVAKREGGRIGEHSWDFYNGAVLGADETRNAIRTRAYGIERGE